VLGRQTVWQNDGSNNYSLWVAWTLNHLGHAAQLHGDYQRAAELHQESLAIFRSLVYQNIGLSWAYHSLGETTLGMGRLDEAARWLAQGLTISQTLSDQASIPWCLAGLGSVPALDEEPERAARLDSHLNRILEVLACLVQCFALGIRAGQLLNPGHKPPSGCSSKTAVIVFGFVMMHLLHRRKRKCD
jgi:tetratricopeptide (TPR) repeat protein